MEIQSLRDALDNLSTENLYRIFKTFKCPKDDDIENFLTDYSIDYENKNVSRTFFVMDESCPGVILGYFSIGLNVMHFEDPVNVQDAYEGINLYEDGYRPIYKLFMIGKNSNCSINLKMADVFNDTIIPYCQEAQSRIGGDLIYIDCVPELRSYYESLNFEFYDECLGGDLIRMIRSI